MEVCSVSRWSLQDRLNALRFCRLPLLTQGFDNGPVMPTRHQLMPETDFLETGAFLQTLPGKARAQHMVVLPFGQEQVTMGAAILLMHDQRHAFPVRLQLIAEPGGKRRKGFVIHGLGRVEGYVTQAIAYALAPCFLHPVRKAPVTATQDTYSFVPRALKHMT
ncbi:hypothetical protein AA105894_2373 [Asaia spathodeae NBRC 105894]|nr:hypothetical protein AA105894_2373 [Asaia spathodeae NBRC 105894]